MIQTGDIMAYDEGLAQRIREVLQDAPDTEEKKMFGGLCFYGFTAYVLRNY